jgi:hypothetical protein
MSILRAVGATVAAFIAGNVGILSGQTLNQVFFPMPEGLKPEDAAGFAAWVAGLPIAALLGVELSYIFGSLLAGFVGAVVSPAHAKLIAGVSGVLFTLANVANIMAIPHPTWMVILTMITFLPLTFAGAAIGARVRPGA